MPPKVGAERLHRRRLQLYIVGAMPGVGVGTLGDVLRQPILAAGGPGVAGPRPSATRTAMKHIGFASPISKTVVPNGPDWLHEIKYVSRRARQQVCGVTSAQWKRPQSGSSPYCGHPGQTKNRYSNLSGVLTVEHPFPKMDSVQLPERPLPHKSGHGTACIPAPSSRLPVRLRIRAPGVPRPAGSRWRALSFTASACARAQPAVGGCATSNTVSIPKNVAGKASQHERFSWSFHATALFALGKNWQTNV